jgi:hypothetical protein
MCNADVSVVTYNWVENEENAFPDFRLNKQCRDYDAVVKCARQHFVNYGHPRRFGKPKGMLFHLIFLSSFFKRM